ncbi:hypothetical protein [Megamonas hypermegale]|uniref:hypothetical protein n=1 Tax=Megamonas hypermegale TaxID=158847 RepID=UPI0026EF1E76|nr:hypothetical protein [Megamonas hypermegale]
MAKSATTNVCIEAKENVIAETKEAIQEARDIMSGKVKVKKYDSIDEAFRDLGIDA